MARLRYYSFPIVSEKLRDVPRYPFSSSSIASSAAMRFSSGGWVEKSACRVEVERTGRMKKALAPSISPLLLRGGPGDSAADLLECRDQGLGVLGDQGAAPVGCKLTVAESVRIRIGADHPDDDRNDPGDQPGVSFPPVAQAHEDPVLHDDRGDHPDERGDCQVSMSRFFTWLSSWASTASSSLGERSW